MFKDLHNEIEVRRAISPLRQTNADTAIVSQIIDMQNMEVCEFLIATGTLTDADATIAATLDEGDAANLSDAAAVAAADRYGSLPAIAAASNDDAVYKVGYKGKKRYVRLTLTPTGNNSGNIDISAVAVLGGSRKLPAA